MAYLQRKLGNTIIIYLWILPALLLITLFLIKPTLETFISSFFEELKISESSIKGDITALLENENRSGGGADIFRKYSNWEMVLHQINEKYGVTVDKNEIRNTFKVNDVAELYVMKSYKKIGADGTLSRFVGLHNYIKLFTDHFMRIAFRNNFLWLLFFPVITIILGLLFATMIDKVFWGGLAKVIVFIPMSISFVAAGVIWSFMYAKDPDVGTINALFNFFLKLFSYISGHGFVSNFKGIAFLGRPSTVNFALIGAGIWMWVGFAMVIFTTALKAIPEEIIEAAKIDGAAAREIFFKIEIPMIFPTITVVATTLVINVLKVFDIVYGMTGGGPYGSSEVIANRMYRTAFNEGNFEYASAMAVILLLAVIPVMMLNIKSFLFEESIRK